MQPKNVGLRSNRAYCYASVEKFADAVKDYRYVLSAQPNSARVYHNLGIALERENQLEEAKLCFDKVIDLDPSNASAFFMRGTICDKLKLVQEAVDDYSRALKLEKKTGRQQHVQSK